MERRDKSKTCCDNCTVEVRDKSREDSSTYDYAYEEDIVEDKSDVCETIFDI